MRDGSRGEGPARSSGLGCARRSSLNAVLEPVDARTLRAALVAGGAPLSWRKVIAGWKADHEIQASSTTMIAGAPFEALFFETPPVTAVGLDEPFECVLIDAPALSRARPEPTAFAEHFVDLPEHEHAAVFWNLGHDALLVAPRPGGDDHAHFAAFLRGASDAERSALWRAVAAALERRLGRAPVWLSTSGLGVFWPHVRVDERPKYYQHRPYALARPRR